MNSLEYNAKVSLQFRWISFQVMSRWSVAQTFSQSLSIEWPDFVLMNMDCALDELHWVWGEGGSGI